MYEGNMFFSRLARVNVAEANGTVVTGGRWGRHFGDESNVSVIHFLQKVARVEEGKDRLANGWANDSYLRERD